MAMKSIGTGLVVVGAAIAIGGGEIPMGFGDLARQLDLVNKYRIAEAEKRQPTADEQGAYSRYVAYLIGGAFCSIGLILIAISLITGD